MDISESQVPNQNYQNICEETQQNISNSNIYENNDKQAEDVVNKCNRNSCTTQNATNAHPLMFSPVSPISPDYPDLIPEKPKAKSYHEKQKFKPEAHSSVLHLNNTEANAIDLTSKQTIEPSIETYNETLPGNV